MSESMQLISKHPAETVAIGDTIAQSARGGDVVALMGELGAGKTQLVRGLSRGLGLDPKRISSPTFVLMHEYEPPEVKPPPDGRGLTLVHIDAYRVSSLGDLDSLGWASDIDLRRNTLVAVEWADRLGDSLGEDVLTVRMSHAGDEARRLTLTPGGSWRPRWQDLCAALDTFIEQVPRSPCPICKRPVREDESTFPFCSKRCRTIDLGRWIDGRYTISRPVEQSDFEE